MKIASGNEDDDRRKMSSGDDGRIGCGKRSQTKIAETVKERRCARGREKKRQNSKSETSAFANDENKTNEKTRFKNASVDLTGV